MFCLAFKTHYSIALRCRLCRCHCQQKTFCMFYSCLVNFLEVISLLNVSGFNVVVGAETINWLHKRQSSESNDKYNQDRSWLRGSRQRQRQCNKTMVETNEWEKEKMLFVFSTFSLLVVFLLLQNKSLKYMDHIIQFMQIRYRYSRLQSLVHSHDTQDDDDDTAELELLVFHTSPQSARLMIFRPSSWRTTYPHLENYSPTLLYFKFSFIYSSKDAVLSSQRLNWRNIRSLWKQMWTRHLVQITTEPYILVPPPAPPPSSSVVKWMDTIVCVCW